MALGQKLSILSRVNFVSILKHQSIKYGVKVIETDKFYPSSKTYFDCDIYTKV